ncbi:hypothetical protein HMPREF9182_1704 [Streptococcus sp. oral taxon 056 str. F0418]|nr:hypothetical protein HMPREF9182_1704 [Streptococcus sp. oral taxon 056 str. F0418]
MYYTVVIRKIKNAFAIQVFASCTCFILFPTRKIYPSYTDLDYWTTLYTEGEDYKPKN